jgi:hypothetical protein
MKHLLASTLALLTAATPGLASADNSLRALECRAANMFGVASIALEDADGDDIVSVVNGMITLRYKLSSVSRQNGVRGGGYILMTDANDNLYQLDFGRPLKVGKQEVQGTLNYVPKGGTILGDGGLRGPLMPVLPIGQQAISFLSCSVVIERFF